VRLGYGSLQVVQQQSIWKSRIEVSALDGTKFSHTFERGASGPFGDDLPDRWVGRNALLRQYVSIFREYRWFGDNSILGRRKYFYLLDVLSRLAGRPLPGWHDIHGRLYCSADESQLERSGGSASSGTGRIREEAGVLQSAAGGI